MSKELNLILSPEQASSNEAIQRAIAKQLNCSYTDIGHFIIRRKSIDARRGKVQVNMGIRVFEQGEDFFDDAPVFQYRDVRNS
ncbi:MAG TPA: hypothetical protein P5349_06455, partial [Tenuifilaceae bacterium]|nr:hypothetical protein [Tenuifilaceae bacterium]